MLLVCWVYMSCYCMVGILVVKDNYKGQGGQVEGGREGEARI